VQIKDCLDRINNISSQRNVQDRSHLALCVKDVVVILTASRGGSSLFKEALTRSTELLFTSGEESPFLTLTENEFPFIESDELLPEKIKNKNELISNIFDDLGLKLANVDDLNMDEFIDLMRKRLLLQIPSSDFDLSEENLESIFIRLFEDHRFWAGNYDELIRKFLIELTKGDNKNWLFFYDTFLDGPKELYYPLDFKIEDTPFVVPKLKKKLRMSDLKNHSLVFKTPQNAYRIGMFEELFPNANIKYLHMTRGFAQSVNGLMDGWLHNKGFFAKNVSIRDYELNIKGYSDVKPYGKKWWKFDMPPNWKDTIDLSLEEVCLNQWASAHEYALTTSSNLNYMNMKFEDFLQNPQQIMNKVTDFIGISPISISNLPLVMITNKPKRYRWHKRKDIIRNLANRSRVNSLMSDLGYTMEENTWI